MRCRRAAWGRGRYILGIAFLLTGQAEAAPPTPSASEIVQRSVVTNAADWKAQPDYAHRERDITQKIDSEGRTKVEQVRTYEVSMIEGSPYERLIEIDGKALGPSQERDEREKLDREIHRRANESAGERQRRLSEYERDRSDERLLMQEMVKAFRFRLIGEQQINGVECYVLDATPDPKYQPPIAKARVLTGMRGRLYIDTAHYHWVRVEAEVTQPVEFGLFVAKVKPGTRFGLDQMPFGNV
ncbi:MAG: hypothetical protein JOZ62_20805, partial [Acidobacteriaceae bacterium]|nr:hypothetical protein [Acidobacteriaceae bacterium]